ncbi:aquaporin [Tsuneonella dongtanensis]|nr:aquaporin [Tsuneonella dongtanensis]
MRRRLAAEGLGSAFLFAAVIGSGIMADRLSGGSVGLALLANAVATAAILYVLIEVLGAVSGAHFNPAVTLAFRLDREIGTGIALAYVGAQIAGGIVGALLAHLMFDLPLWQFGAKERAGIGQWTAEFVATFGLVFFILVAARRKPATVPAVVALYIAAAYWFTSSTSFANPAITLVRSLTATFAGIAPADVPAFIAAQLAGAVTAVAVARWFGVPAAR